jgi:Raf kinase inhibitor-like YbhB/YbcL family protein
MGAMILTGCTNAAPMNSITISSSAFRNNDPIPSKYTCEGENISPPLTITNLPAHAKYLAIIMHDPDAPMKGGFLHWAHWNIALTETELNENVEPASGTRGENDAGRTGYVGPCPPSGKHRYFFEVFAYVSPVSLPSNASKDTIMMTFSIGAIARGKLMGTYIKMKQ